MFSMLDGIFRTERSTYECISRTGGELTDKEVSLKQEEAVLLKDIPLEQEEELTCKEVLWNRRITR